ncbi:HAMP domain-containing sensor histidine kinase [Bombilactobacillus thymidiniphilus]|uniref:Signal transduction histidine-protein kinase ArlS n=1 Tax=Bombilactobacillus thymidiniphilus TaxID=2923363 RepID=A0ABY4PC87_9LACO|nr:HAMP domain-containing histidine kinase [Bombilactobacillus thymidiniphilus]UQS83374.1 HAMP domain-containing histidine kinase [Bombilactobacillus thymidiniphilus]
MSLAFFVVFGIFSTLIYTSVTRGLLTSETNNVRDTMSAVDSRFNVYHTPLTQDQVHHRLSPHVPRKNLGRDQEGRLFTENPEDFYRDSLSKQLTRGDLSLVLYNDQGQVLFQSGDISADFAKTDVQKKIVLVNPKHGPNYLAVTMPIRSSSTHKIIGYAKINDGLRNYHHTIEELHRNIIATVLVVLILSFVLGYFLTQPLVRRIHQINRTIDKIDEDPDSQARIPVQQATDEITDLAERFNHMLDRMQEYTNQQKEFVEDVSHELRTPVAVIEGHLKLLQRWGKDDPQVLDESIDASVNEISRMKKLIQEMLDLTRAEQIETNYTNEITQANATIEQAYNDFRMLHPDFKIDLDNTVPDNTQVQIYRNHLMQILVVLLDNAVKYSKDRKEINLSTSTENGMLSIAVQDFGVGINQQDLQRIFNRFYRVDKARSRESGGNGLGLPIAKKIVEMYKGTITAESAVGSGTVFRVNIPLVNKNKINM